MSDAFEVHSYAAARNATLSNARRSGPVSVTRVSAELLAAALVAADGDYRRIQILSATEVLITNQGRGRS
jgi:hypothetical protein